MLYFLRSFSASKARDCALVRTRAHPFTSVFLFGVGFGYTSSSDGVAGGGCSESGPGEKRTMFLPEEDSHSGPGEERTVFLPEIDEVARGGCSEGGPGEERTVFLPEDDGVAGGGCSEGGPGEERTMFLPEEDGVAGGGCSEGGAREDSQDTSQDKD